MGPEWVAIIALVALFVVGTVLPINMGALAYVAAWFVGMYSLGLDESEILGGISASLVLTLIGVTYLFAIARQNGTVDLIVSKALGLVGGRVAFIPWVMFAVTAVITAIGAASPAACAIIGPIALGFAGRYKINPLMMGMLVVHGAQAGGFSPISIYGTITNSVMIDNGLGDSSITIFLSSLVVNTVLAGILFVALGGVGLMRMRLDGVTGEVVSGGTTEQATDHAGDRHRDRTSAASGTGARPTTGTSPTASAVDGTGTAGTAVQHEVRGETRDHVLTLVAFAAVAAAALVLDRDIGLAAITAAVVLSIISPRKYEDTVKQIAWPTVLLVAGISTYATILTTAGSPEAVGLFAAGLGAAAIGALILCYVGGVASAFASSTALLPVIIPIAIPLIAEGGISAGLFVAALAVSSTIVDVSPFSTNGALMLANRPETVGEATYFRQILTYSVIVTLAGPLLVWAALVLPGW